MTRRTFLAGLFGGVVAAVVGTKVKAPTKPPILTGKCPTEVPGWASAMNTGGEWDNYTTATPLADLRSIQLQMKARSYNTRPNAIIVSPQLRELLNGL